MRFLVAILFVVFTVSQAVNNKKFAVITDGMRCRLCQHVVENEATWAKLDEMKEGDMLKEAFKICESVFHQGFEELERLVCDDFATHSAPVVREHKMSFRHGTHSSEGLCKNAAMRALTLSLLVVLVQFTVTDGHKRPNPFDVIARKHELLDNNTKQYLCDMCTDVVEATEEWIGSEGHDGLEKVVSDCIAAISKGTPIGFAQFICDTLFGDTVRPIIKQLNDSTFRVNEAKKVCGQITVCPSVYPSEH
ncbi:hypothetical protein M3Y98_00245800 [Aphelenchoides besseyi]|nr:hypothetical protein M3Y98_00245800 [Aphelenchoides besseyi]KAI6200719.1 hypothetical protein M3Y96_00763900 [Aphelenchoides besseyi]